MSVLATVAVLLVAALHLGFLVLEMFLWTRPQGRAVFGTDADFAARSAPLAANQGLYNGFLAAGLVWGTVVGGDTGYAVTLFFLACVIVAGIYGAATVNRRIVLVQAVPAMVALALVMAAGS